MYHHTLFLVTRVRVRPNAFEWVLLVDEHRRFIVLDADAIAHISSQGSVPRLLHVGK